MFSLGKRPQFNISVKEDYCVCTWEKTAGSLQSKIARLVQKSLVKEEVGLPEGELPRREQKVPPAIKERGSKRR